MKPVEIATAVRDILIDEGKNETLASVVDSESKRIPFLHKFPSDCCEPATYLLGAAINTIHPNSDILIYTGKYKNINHFWLTVDGLIFDITIDQFKNIKEPIIGSRHINKNLISSSTNNINDSFSSWDQAHKEEWLIFILKKLNDR